MDFIGPPNFLLELGEKKDKSSLYCPNFSGKPLQRWLWNECIYPKYIRKGDLSFSTSSYGSRFSQNQIITVHDLISIHNPKQHPLQTFYFKYILPGILKNAKAIVTVSEHTKKDLIKYYSISQEKIWVIYNGIDHSLFKPINQLKSKQPYLLMPGVTYPHKNAEVLFKAFAQIQASQNETYKYLKLILTGQPNPYYEGLKKLAHSLEIHPQVEFLEYVSKGKLVELYQNAQATILPSLYEGFGLTPVEAMACGCPVICSNTGSLPEVAGEGALYFSPNSTSELARCIESILDNPILRSNLLQKGYQISAKYHWEYSAHTLMKLIENLMNKG